MKCPNCGRQIDDGSSFCVFCAERTSSAARVVIDTDRKSRLYPVLFAVIAAVTVFSVLAVTSVHRAFGNFRPGTYTPAESGVNGGSSDGTEVTAAEPAITGTDPDHTETADGQTSPGTEPEPVTAPSETETAPPETDGETAEPETAAPATVAPVTEIKETHTPVTAPPETTPPETAAPETTPPETDPSLSPFTRRLARGAAFPFWGTGRVPRGTRTCVSRRPGTGPGTGSPAPVRPSPRQ